MRSSCLFRKSLVLPMNPCNQIPYNSREDELMPSSRAAVLSLRLNPLISDWLRVGVGPSYGQRESRLASWALNSVVIWAPCLEGSCQGLILLLLLPWNFHKLFRQGAHISVCTVPENYVACPDENQGAGDIKKKKVHTHTYIFTKTWFESSIITISRTPVVAEKALNGGSRWWKKRYTHEDSDLSLVGTQVRICTEKTAWSCGFDHCVVHFYVFLWIVCIWGYTSRLKKQKGTV